MGRVEVFKEVRRRKTKYVLLFLFVLVIMTLGILTVDSSVNHLMNDESSIKIFSVKNMGDAHLEICIMNKKLYVNIQYINRDIQWLKDALDKLF